MVELLDQALGLLGEAHIAALLALRHGRSTVEGRLPMRLRSDPAGEAVGVEPVGRQVECFGGGIGCTSGAGIVTRQRGVRAGSVHVRRRGVPLAFPVRAVACRAEVVAERRHSVRVEPKGLSVERLLSAPRGLAGPMEGRIVAGEDGGPRRDAGGRRRVVTLEVDAVFAQQVLGLEILLAKRLCGLGLVDRRVPHLIADEDQEVRPFAFWKRRRCVERVRLRGRGFAAAVRKREGRRYACGGGQAALQEATATQCYGAVRFGRLGCVALSHGLSPL